MMMVNDGSVMVNDDGLVAQFTLAFLILMMLHDACYSLLAMNTPLLCVRMGLLHSLKCSLWLVSLLHTC